MLQCHRQARLIRMQAGKGVHLRSSFDALALKGRLLLLQ